MVRHLAVSFVAIVGLACASTTDSKDQSNDDGQVERDPGTKLDTPPDAPPGDLETLEDPPSDGTPTVSRYGIPLAPQPGRITFEAKVEIDDRPGGKRFQGVWLVDGDTRYVIDYRARPWWLSFDEKKVRVTGETYFPEGQAIGADHFRVHAMELLNAQPVDDLHAVYENATLVGTFTTHAWPKKSKMGGTTTTVFKAEDGTEYWLHDRSAVEIELDKEVEIRAIAVEPSTMVARPGGPYLWVIEIVR